MGKGSPRRQHVVGQGGLKYVKLPRFYHGCFSLPEGLMYQAQCLLLCKTPWLSFPITVSPCFVIRTQASAKWLWRDSRTSSGTDLCAVSGPGGGGQAGGWQTGFSVCRQSNLPDSSLIGENTSWLQYIHDSFCLLGFGSLTFFESLSKLVMPGDAMRALCSSDLSSIFFLGHGSLHYHVCGKEGTERDSPAQTLES